MQVGNELLQIIAFALRQEAQLFHYALLHLVGSLIGEGYRQYVLMILLAIGEVVKSCFLVFLAQEYLDVFIG